jgi:hypothetical protein
MRSVLENRKEVLHQQMQPALPPPPLPTTTVRYTWVHAVGGGGGARVT